MVIPKLTEEQRIESFLSERLSDFDEGTVTFTKEELAKLCLREIDFAMEVVNSTDIKDVEEQYTEDKKSSPTQNKIGIDEVQER